MPDALPILLRLPAEPRYAPIARTAAAAVAGRLAVGVDRVEDLRLAVGELMALAVVADPGGDVELRFGGDADVVEVTARFRSAAELPEDGFAWLVLRGLAGRADQQLDGDRLQIHLTLVPAADALGPEVGTDR